MGLILVFDVFGIVVLEHNIKKVNEMDNATHALLGAAAGIVVGDIFSESILSLAVCGAIAGQLPDLDILGSKGDDVYYMKHHRAHSHALIFTPIMAVIFAAVYAVFSGASFAALFWSSFWALILHIGTDILNSYGTYALWPFKRKRLAADILAICDIYILVILAGGILGSFLWRIECIYWAWTGFVFYIILRILLRQKAKRIVLRDMRRNNIWQIVIVPKMYLFNWSYIAMSDEDYLLGQVHLHTNRTVLLAKYPRPILEVWENSERMKAFMTFSRFPYCYERNDEKVWMDMRYGLSKKTEGPLRRKKK